MKKVRNFCKLYFAEILFAFAVLWCIGLAMYGIFCLPKMAAMGMMTFAVVALAVLGYYLQKLEKTVSQPSKVFTRAWYAGFALLMLAMIVGTSIVCLSVEMLSLYILLIISCIAFVAMFGHLAMVVNAAPQQSKSATLTADAGDD